jgi:hypothetical protein
MLLVDVARIGANDDAATTYDWVAGGDFDAMLGMFRCDRSSCLVL